MYKFLLKYDFVKVIPFNKTFFYRDTLPKKIQLSQDLLRINYSKHSPYKAPNILSFSQNKELMIWFYDTDYSNYILIPESFIFFRELYKEKKDTIYVLEDEIYKVLVIKNDKLLSSYSLEAYDKDLIQITSNEFNIENIKELNRLEVQDIYKKGLNELTIKELVQFNQIDLDKKKLLNIVIDKVTYPIVFFVFFMCFCCVESLLSSLSLSAWYN
jgi:hypothetical protein